MKEPKCKLCGGPHYKTWCPTAPRKPIPVYKPLQRSVKPIKSKPYTFTPKPLKPLKRAKIKPKSDNYRKKLIVEADKVFSVYIRTRFGSIARCVTCGTIGDWKNFHNGHFISRRKMATRFDEMNCNVQCENCNVTLGGNLQKYEKYLLYTHGYEALQDLKFRSLMVKKYTTGELELLIEHYKHKVNK